MKWKSAGYSLLFIFVLLSLCSCGIHTIKPEFNLPDQNLHSNIDKNKTRVIFFNDSNMVIYGLDGSGKINVKLNGKALGSLKIHNYVQIYLDGGSYDLILAHWDMVTFESKYQINIGGDNVYIQVYSQPTSTAYQLVSELPEKFAQKYTPIY
jgi:hypothetical protein